MRRINYLPGARVSLLATCGQSGWSRPRLKAGAAWLWPTNLRLNDAKSFVIIRNQPVGGGRLQPLSALAGRFDHSLPGLCAVESPPLSATGYHLSLFLSRARDLDMGPGRDSPGRPARDWFGTASVCAWVFISVGRGAWAYPPGYRVRPAGQSSRPAHARMAGAGPVRRAGLACWLAGRWAGPPEWHWSGRAGWPVGRWGSRGRCGVYGVYVCGWGKMPHRRPAGTTGRSHRPPQRTV